MKDAIIKYGLAGLYLTSAIILFTSILSSQILVGLSLVGLLIVFVGIPLAILMIIDM